VTSSRSDVTRTLPAAAAADDDDDDGENDCYNDVCDNMSNHLLFATLTHSSVISLSVNIGSRFTCLYIVDDHTLLFYVQFVNYSFNDPFR